MSLGETLLQRGLITAAQLEQAMAARKSTERIEHCLVRLGFVKERDCLEVYSEQLSIPLIDLTEVEIDRELLKQTPSKVVHRDRVIPIDRINGVIRALIKLASAAVASPCYCRWHRYYVIWCLTITANPSSR